MSPQATLKKLPLSVVCRDCFEDASDEQRGCGVDHYAPGGDGWAPASDPRHVTPELGEGSDWRCECGDLNRDHESGCYRCGAGQPEAEPAQVPGPTCADCGRRLVVHPYARFADGRRSMECPAHGLRDSLNTVSGAIAARS